ncbi:hypothetical protein [Methylobacillus glycogenes]|uniref:hypothetical protein n=1 Tax=Methylobacillus glycogenes TaxID=406 RepID=UPI00046EFD99|nr:hypothetical protein [Methylobacillus glycogenes]MBL8505450.1 hypothetical protein [Methylobacillus glycogenes]
MKTTTAFCTALLLTMAVSTAHADSILPFATSLLGTWKPLPQATSNQKPDVDTSLNLFASSILGKSERQASAVSNEQPDVDKSLALFASSILQ